MNELFNNREIASGVWLLGLVVAVAAKSPDVRESFKQVLKVARNWKIVVSLVLLAAYTALCVALLYCCRLWSSSMLKDTVYWFFLSGIVLHANVLTESDYKKCYRKAIKGCVAAIVLLEFLVNFYTFPLLLEFILVPFLALIAMGAVYAEGKPEHAVSKKFFDGILMFFGTIVLIYAVRRAYLSYTELLRLDSVRGLLLPVELTLLFLPFLYVSKLISEYEFLFARLSWFLEHDKELLSHMKARILRTCHINLGRVGRFAREHVTGGSCIRTRDDVDAVFEQFLMAD